jgi:hypothetical protein
LPAKSAADAGALPAPVTAQFAVLAWPTAPERVTVKVKAVLLLWPEPGHKLWFSWTFS